MRVIIAGCRDIFGETARRFVSEAISESGWKSQINEVIHGAASGIDTAAGEYCKDRWKVTAVPAEWDKYGKSAGPIRNRQMAAMGDALIAVWDGKSRGTRNMISEATALGLKVFVLKVTQVVLTDKDGVRKISFERQR